MGVKETITGCANLGLFVPRKLGGLVLSWYDAHEHHHYEEQEKMDDEASQAIDAELNWLEAKLKQFDREREDEEFVAWRAGWEASYALSIFAKRLANGDLKPELMLGEIKGLSIFMEDYADVLQEIRLHPQVQKVLEPYWGQIFPENNPAY